MRAREIHTCIRCRESKRQCDKLKPFCSRCLRAGASCSYESASTSSEPRYGSRQALSKTYTDSSSTSSQLSIADLAALPALAIESQTTQTTNGNRARVIRRRERATLSCTRCHRLKVKCDKKLPCDRCTRSDYDDTCNYTHKPEQSYRTKGSSLPFAPAEDEPEEIVVTWFLRRRGSSHWKALLLKLESLPLPEPSIFLMAVREHSEGDCGTDLILDGNYPFGSSEVFSYASLESIHALIRSSESMAQTYVDNYFRLYQVVYPILDIDVFQEEYSKFRQDPLTKLDLRWLAQLLLVLGLGAFAEDRDEQNAASFFYAGEACLARTPYMFRPTMRSLRTLCLMVVAKQVANATCWSLDACWNILGVIIRIAAMMGLHDDSAPIINCSNPSKECRSRRALWSIIVYLDIHVSLINGQPSLLPLQTLTPPTTDYFLLDLEDCWVTLLPESFPLILQFVSRTNSSDEELTYEEVLQYNAAIREFMQRLASAKGSPILRLSLDIFFRRVLMTLHWQKALHENAPLEYPTSYWSSLECSLAMLVHHRELSEEHNLPQNIDLIGRPFMLDFYSGAITSCLHLLRDDTPLSAPTPSDSVVPPRQTILDTLMSCHNLFARERQKSVCFRSGFQLLTAILAIIPGIDKTLLQQQLPHEADLASKPNPAYRTNCREHFTGISPSFHA
ncbi:hypothetical protein BDV96DRAFT_113214 [Lophiotrema nucula]|uniref:Zn(2)-C6 fungal-type domain-containing protein n=1 Tax=Lophiotrema nucula TaxID=690887 RepID=A0A6A5Z3P9_9PLEO|nr:hypothetical protein BDV96DRAFT_113214 [Lophiotrema nucula]